MVNGVCGSRPAIGSVVRICRRRGTTGRSTPASSPTCLDQAPAAQTTVSVATVPRLVSTAVMVAPSVDDAGDRAASDQAGAGAPRRPGVAEHDRLRGAVPVLGRPGGGQQPLGVDQRREPLGLGDVDHPAGHAQLVLDRHVPLERLDLVGLVEQEQVADLAQVDVLAELTLEGLERPQAPQPELDVDRVGELRAHSPGRPAGGAGPELVPLEQQHVRNPGPGQVVGRAQTDHAATHDDDGRARRELSNCHGHPRFGRDSWDRDPSSTR